MTKVGASWFSGWKLRSSYFRKLISMLWSREFWEKHCHESARTGQKSFKTDTHCPVKMRLSNSALIHRVLKPSNNQRAFAALKKITFEEPNKHSFIRRGVGLSGETMKCEIFTWCDVSLLNFFHPMLFCAEDSKKHCKGFCKVAKFCLACTRTHSIDQSGLSTNMFRRIWERIRNSIYCCSGAYSKKI